MTTASRPPATALLWARVRATCSCYTTLRGTTLRWRLQSLDAISRWQREAWAGPLTGSYDAAHHIED